MTDQDATKFREIIQGELKPVTQRLDNMDQRLDGHGASLVEIESILKGYKESYQQNEDHIGKLNKRVSRVENHLGLSISQD